MNEPTDPRAAKRNRWLTVAAAVTFAATAWAALESDDVPSAPARSRTGSASATAATTTTATATASPDRTPRSLRTAASAPAPADAWPEAPSTQRRGPWPAAAAQGVSAWAAPTLPAAPVAPPPTQSVMVAVQPQAPAFPYTLIGRLDNGEPRALLSGPLRSFGVKPADVLDGAWRIDTVGAQGITVTWLPAGLKRTIPFASS